MLKLFVGFDQWVLVTPAMAQRWLAQYLPEGVHQRGVTKSSVAQYAADQDTGRWVEDSPEPVILVTNGGVVDGQHRLLAVIKNGRPVRLKVVVIGDDLARKLMPVLNTGRKRNNADIRRVSTGSTSAGKETDLARTIMALERGAYKSQPSPGVISEFADRNIDAIMFAIDIPKHKGRAAPPSCVYGALAFCYPASPEGIADFAARLTELTGLRAGDPALRLHDAIVQLRATGNAGSQMRYKQAMLTVCAAWHYLNGNTVQILRENEGARQWFLDRRASDVGGVMKVPVSPKANGSSSYNYANRVAV